MQPRIPAAQNGTSKTTPEHFAVAATYFPQRARASTVKSSEVQKRLISKYAITPLQTHYGINAAIRDTMFSSKPIRDTGRSRKAPAVLITRLTSHRSNIETIQANTTQRRNGVALS